MYGEAYSDFREVVKEIHDMIHQPSSSAQAEQPMLQPAAFNMVTEGLESGAQIFSVQIVLSPDCLMKAARYHILCKRVEDVCGSVLATSIQEKGLDEQGKSRSITSL